MIDDVRKLRSCCRERTDPPARRKIHELTHAWSHRPGAGTNKRRSSTVACLLLLGRWNAAALKPFSKAWERRNVKTRSGRQLLWESVLTKALPQISLRHMGPAEVLPTQHPGPSVVATDPGRTVTHFEVSTSALLRTPRWSSNVKSHPNDGKKSQYARIQIAADKRTRFIPSLISYRFLDGGRQKDQGGADKRIDPTTVFSYGA